MIAYAVSMLDRIGGASNDRLDRYRTRMVVVTALLIAATSSAYLVVWIGFLGTVISPLSVGMLIVSLIGSLWCLMITRTWRNLPLAAFVMVTCVIANLAVSSLVQGGFDRLQLVGLTLTPVFIAYIGGVRWSSLTAAVVFVAETVLFVLQERGIELERLVGDDLMAMDALASGLTGAMFVVVFSAFYVASIKIGAVEEGRLNLQLDEVRARARMKADFVSVLGNELEAPLRRIDRRLKRLRPIVSAVGDDRQKKNFGMLSESSTHLRTIINDLLDLERIESGTITRSDFSIHVPKLVQDVVNSHLPAAEKKNLQLHAEIGATRRLVSDPIRVRQILDNLVTNAIKYSDRGIVLIAVREDENGIHFKVKDQGIGIAHDRLIDIFQPMYQIDQSRARRQDGVGLGLYIVRQLVQLLGGRLSVKSQVEHGTTFTLSFPARMIDSRDHRVKS